jgi:hypothetical protein
MAFCELHGRPPSVAQHFEPEHATVVPDVLRHDRHSISEAGGSNPEVVGANELAVLRQVPKRAAILPAHVSVRRKRGGLTRHDIRLAPVTAAMLSAWLVFLALDFLSHAVVLADWWRATESYWLPPVELFKRIPYGYGALALPAGTMTWLLVRLRGPQPRIAEARVPLRLFRGHTESFRRSHDTAGRGRVLNPSVLRVD